MQTATQKRIAKSILGIVNKAIETAMKTIDVHEGRYMKRELKLEEALLEPKHKTGKRKYVHTAAYWARKNGLKRKYTKRDKKYWNKKK